MRATVKVLIISLVSAILVIDAVVWIVGIDRLTIAASALTGGTHVAEGCSVWDKSLLDPQHSAEEARKSMHLLKRDGRLELWETPLGRMWAPTNLLPPLIADQHRDIYGIRSFVKSEYVVIDCGGNVGATVKSALSAGASKVVAVEPEPVALECLRRNLSSEIAANRVVVVPKGVWHESGEMDLNRDPMNGGAHSLVLQRGGDRVRIQLTTIDAIVKELGLTRVDFIKLDIEGSEENALLGGAETIRKFHPKLAIALEHKASDPVKLPMTALRFWSGYQKEWKACALQAAGISPEAVILH